MMKMFKTKMAVIAVAGVLLASTTAGAQMAAHSTMKMDKKVAQHDR